MNKKASDILNMICIEKEAGIMGDVIGTIKGATKSGANTASDVVKDTVSDIKKATGFEKFTPKHDVGLNALKGAGVGGVVGATGAVTTNTGEKKDNFGAAIKGGLVGAVGGAALGAGGSHILNKKDAEVFNASNEAFKRGISTGAVAGGAGATIGKDGVKKGVDAVKEHIPNDTKERIVNMYDGAKSKVGDALDSSVDNLSAAKNKAVGFVDSVNKKVEEVSKKLNGHQGNPPKHFKKK